MDSLLFWHAEKKGLEQAVPSKARQKCSSGAFLSRRVDELIAPNTPHQARQVFSDKTQHTSGVPPKDYTVDTISTVQFFPF